MPDLPRPAEVKHEYDAVGAEAHAPVHGQLVGRFSYTLSRLFRNYPGLASSDEIARVAPNVTRLFDGLVMAFRPGGGAGVQAASTPIARTSSSSSGVYVLPSRTTLAGVPRAAGGIPVTRQVNMISSLPVFYNGRLSDGRTPWLTVTDLSVAAGHSDAGQAGQGATQPERVQPVRSDKVSPMGTAGRRRENLPVPLETFFAGFDVQQRIASTAGIRIDPRFLQDSAWQAAREIRFGVKLIF